MSLMASPILSEYPSVTSFSSCSCNCSLAFSLSLALMSSYALASSCAEVFSDTMNPSIVPYLWLMVLKREARSAVVRLRFLSWANSSAACLVSLSKLSDALLTASANFSLSSFTDLNQYTRAAIAAMAIVTQLVMKNAFIL